MRTVISSRYYPMIHGKRNTRFSYRSYRVGGCLAPSDVIIGLCDDSVPYGWIRGPRGGYATKTAATLPTIVSVPV
jgi:hypothetical protein